MNYDYVLSLFEKSNFSGDPYKAIALMQYAMIDMSENNPHLMDIIEHIENNEFGEYILYKYDEGCDEWVEHICRTVLTEYEVDEDITNLEDSLVDEILYEVSERIRPYFDVPRYVSDLNLSVEDAYATDDYDWVTVLDTDYLIAQISR